MKWITRVIPTKGKPAKAATVEQKSLQEDQLRKIRSVLNVHYLGNCLRSILITSLAPEEGKTTVSLNLSATIARGLDNSVILVDADMRKRGLSILLGLEDTPGLSEVLEGRENIQTVMVQTDMKGLSILPAGLYSLSHAELIASSRMKNLIQQLKNTYENSYIIIDSAPFLPTSDVHDLSNMVDASIIVILAEKTRRDIVINEITSINRNKILGVVLNGAIFETSYNYQKYYRHYYGQRTQ